MIRTFSARPRWTRQLTFCALLGGATTLGLDQADRSSALDPGTDVQRSVQEQDPARSQSARRPFLVELFPQTSALLEHLESADPSLHAQLEAHATRLLQESEQDALAFARKHHPELAEVLDDLRQGGNRRAYDRAIRELVRDSRRLAPLENRAPRVWATGIESWKNRSRLRLLAARSMLPRNGTRSETRPTPRFEPLIRALQQSQRAGLERRAERLRRQLERLEGRLAEDPEVALQRELRSLRAKIEGRRGR